MRPRNGLSRRDFLSAGTVISVLYATPSKAQDTTLPLPNKANFEAGDLVWPKKPGAYVPYRSGEDSALNQDEDRWNLERNRFLIKSELIRNIFHIPTSRFCAQSPTESSTLGMQAIRDQTFPAHIRLGLGFMLAT
jgi:hypothetical protein